MPATSDVSVFKCALLRVLAPGRALLCLSAGVVPVRAGVIAPVVPPLPSGGGRMADGPGVVSLARGPLPLPSLPPGRTSTVVYGLSAVDDRGRVADRVVMRALGWSAGRGLDIREADGVLTVFTAPDGAYQVTSQGHLRLPAVLRHRCGLVAGDRVLLAVDPSRSRLTIYPPTALDNALTQPTEMAGGESA
jgi:hypothetical protein